ncbi:MAG: deoxyribonuclease V [Solitalea-like symbiont of Tyrophagus putrescentiae]
MQASINYGNISIEQAKQIQQELLKKLQIKEYKDPINTIAGADISFNISSNVAYGCIVILDFGTLKPIYLSLAKGTLNFPYIPGYLAFREMPILFKAWEQMQVKPDILMVDGHGISHPKQMGIATQLGILLNQTTIGCAKNLLCGNYSEPNPIKGSIKYLEYQDTILGAIMRSKTNVKPIYISPGHKINLEASIKITEKCITKYRIPEPTRQAHKIVNLFRQGILKSGFIALKDKDLNI